MAKKKKRVLDLSAVSTRTADLLTDFADHVRGLDEQITREMQHQGDLRRVFTEAAQAKAVAVAETLLPIFDETVDHAQRFGSYLALLIIPHTGAVEPRNQIPRAMWLLDWLIDYFIKQELAVSDLTSNVNHGDAVRAVADLATQDRKLRKAPPAPIVDAEWQQVYRSSIDVFNAVMGGARP